MSHTKKMMVGTVSALGLLCLSCAIASAQHAAQTKEGASIIVDGTVREIFRSPRQTVVDYVIQVDAARSEYGRSPADPKRVQAPAPGDQVYVHVFQPVDTQRPAGARGHSTIPAEGSQIRAYLYPRAQGGWDGAFPDWFDQTGVVAGNPAPNVPEPPAGVPTQAPGAPSSAGAPAAGSILHRLGIRAEQVHVSGRLVLKILDVAPDSPAGKAGVEPGDAIVGVNGGFITDLDQMAAAILKGGPAATLAILDIRNGKQAAVKVDVSSLIAEEAAQHRPEPTPAPAPVATRVLGVKTQPVRIGLRTTAVQVTEVQEGSPAAKAGIEKGDVILDADGTPSSDPAQLEAAVQKGGAVMTLKVFDPRSRREVPVQVHFDTAVAQGNTPVPGNIPQPAPVPVPGGGASSARSIGIIAEAGTADLLPVVKVVQVVPGSPAEKAGIEPGDAIVGLNDKVIFAPDLLDEALKTAGNAFTLNVLDVKTGKKTPVKINVQ